MISKISLRSTYALCAFSLRLVPSIAVSGFGGVLLDILPPFPYMLPESTMPLRMARAFLTMSSPHIHLH
jgi:hypothetical protein